jgi:hypothetical protein
MAEEPVGGNLLDRIWWGPRERDLPRLPECAGHDADAEVGVKTGRRKPNGK